MSILNLTQHEATQEQLQDGVVEPSNKEMIKKLLTFEELPTSGILKTRAETIAMYAASTGHKSAMIGGAPYFMSYLEQALFAAGVRPLYAFSVRESVEINQTDGSMKKSVVFRHVGFVGTEFAEV